MHKCLIDGRFSLKIGSVRYESLVSSLKNDRDSNVKNGQSKQEANKNPLLLSRKNRKTVAKDVNQKNDIQAFGEIATTLLELNEKGTVDQYPGPKQDFPLLRDFLTKCKNEDLKLRPTILVTAKSFDHLSGSRKGDVMALVMKRIENYTETLEERVAEKTRELVLEQAKADSLLREMLPP